MFAKPKQAHTSWRLFIMVFDVLVLPQIVKLKKLGWAPIYTTYGYGRQRVLHYILNVYPDTREKSSPIHT